MLPRLNGELLIARPLGSPFVETAEEMVRGWRYEKPRRAPISLFVRLLFCVYLCAFEVTEGPVAPVDLGRAGRA